ncbi:MAG: biotin transporter BioY [Castellaniella sp.]|uniref:biotin transporter BioY n=1 Tax=Castellaniella sp. TaxID=1955812 RepID=UPI00121A64A6|nr:biotin transporter BioY [Castellaniella sp.]TAN31123.1 MAG: biotin transporter BioY [Castellaniella sp.]
MSLKDSTFPASAAARPTRIKPAQIGLVLMGTLILAASAQISIPMWPVPLTMELYAVMLIGAFFGWRLGAVTIAAWLLEGALGLPVFAHGTGSVASFMGPTAGYLLSFPLVGAIVGLVTMRGRQAFGPLRVFAGLWFAGLICLLAGWAWLSVLIGAKAAWASGVVPFLFGDAVKAALATATLVVWRTIRSGR